MLEITKTRMSECEPELIEALTRFRLKAVGTLVTTSAQGILHGAD